MKRYRLLKDLPDLKAGAVFEWDKNKFYNNGIGIAETYSFWPGTISNNPDWFEKIKEKSDVEVLAEWMCNILKISKVDVADPNWYFNLGEMKRPIVLEGKPFDWEDGAKAIENVVDETGEVNWYAAHSADPGVMKCKGCNEFLWREGLKVKCPHCGNIWRTNDQTR